MSILDEFLSQFQLDPPEDVPEEIKEKHRFLSHLSQKDTRSVYLLQNCETGQKEILKIALLKDPEDLKREHQLLEQLEHPAIPRAFGYWEQAGKQYLLRSYAEGETLDMLLSRDGAFSERQALEIVLSLCDILSYLHQQNPPVVFRDIKPQNIILTPNGKLSLIDFGIAKELSNDAEDHTVGIGTKGFAAPEIYGFSQTGTHTDIYAVGSLLLYLITGSFEKSACADVPSRSLRKVINTCTRLSPKRRYRSVEALARRIQLLADPPSLAQIAGCVTVGVLVVAVGISWWSRSFIQTAGELDPITEPLIVGAGYEKEAAFPVNVTVTKGNEPFADCVVAIDDRHWYEPTETGQAMLWAYAYDMYTLRAASGNQTALFVISVNRGSGLSYALDFDRVPRSPEYLIFEGVAGQRQTFPLEVSGASEVQLEGTPEGISATVENGQTIITADRELPAGFYSFFIVAKNDYGFSCTAVGLHVKEDATVVPVNTAEGFDEIRNGLSGHYELTADIDLSGYAGWQPIGTQEQPFTGEFSGNGFRIIGLTISGESTEAGLFGSARGAVFRNVVLEEPQIVVNHEKYGNVGALAATLEDCFLENCAVLGGRIEATVGYQSNIGSICGYGQGMLFNCFNSAELQVTTLLHEDDHSYTGGICGTLMGYLAGCGNTGAVNGNFIAGGLVGMNDNSVVTRSYNAGPVIGPMANGSILPGGISHVIRVGRYNANSCYQEDCAEVGVTTTTSGYPFRLAAVEREVFRDPEQMSAIFRSEDAVLYATQDSYYPMPQGIFPSTTKAPVIRQNGNRIAVDAADGIVYYYSLDGSEPRLAETGARSLDIELSEGQVLQIYAASKGAYDSETVTVK